MTAFLFRPWTKRTAFCRPRLESLEDRWLPAPVLIARVLCVW